MTVPSDVGFDPTTHLSRKGIAEDNTKRPAVVQDLFIGRTDGDLCPVAAFMGYLVIREMQPGPLFMFQDGQC